jgi:Tol biopolymer transport system component
VSGASKEEGGSKVRVISDKQPPGRDGHSSYLHDGKWIIFGGDRHHMPFNDTYVLDLNKLSLE